MRPSHCFLFALVIGLHSLTAETDNVRRVGDPAPPMIIEEMLQGPSVSGDLMESLKGKVVILEFWATWCAPCIRSIPHMNELSEKFRDQPVQFIAITEEARETVSPFLERKPINGWVGLDRDRSLLDAIETVGLPGTITIDLEGKIASITHPTRLKEEHIEKLLAGESIQLISPVKPKPIVNKDESSEPLFQVVIRENNLNSQCLRWGNGLFEIIGQGVDLALSASYGVKSDRMVFDLPLPEGKYDFLVNVPNKDQELASEILQKAIQSTFNLECRWETRELDVLVLTSREPRSDRIQPTVSTGGSSWGTRPGGIAVVNLKMINFAEDFLGSLLEKPVIDETGITESVDFEFDMELDWPVDSELLASTMEEELGLVLTPARRAVKVLIVDQKKGAEGTGLLTNPHE